MVALEILTWLTLGLFLGVLGLYVFKQNGQTKLTLLAGGLGACAGGSIAKLFSARVDLLSPYVAAAGGALFALMVLWMWERSQLTQ